MPVIVLVSRDDEHAPLHPQHVDVSMQEAVFIANMGTMVRRIRAIKADLLANL